MTFTIVWSLVLANVFGTLILLPLTGQLAKLALVRIQILAPVIISILFLASFLTTRDYGDLIVVIGFGLFAWVMKLAGWPRPPLVLGLVLGPVIGKYLFISTHAYGGFGWLARPGVVLLFLAMVASVAFGLVREKRGGSVRGK